MEQAPWTADTFHPRPYNGHRWAASHTFSKAIGAGLAISRTDVWVFGEVIQREHVHRRDLALRALTASRHSGPL